MFCVDKITYEHLAILSNLKSCQFAPRIMIFNLSLCCQFDDLQIISAYKYKNNSCKPSQHLQYNCDKWGLIFCINIGLFLLVHNSEFLDDILKELLYQNAFQCGRGPNGLTLFNDGPLGTRRVLHVMPYV